jgi:hypothetical protein
MFFRTPKIRYIYEDGVYKITIRKYVAQAYGIYSLAGMLNTDSATMQDRLVNTYNAELIIIGRYPIYAFKTKKQTKIAIDWLRSIQILNHLIG